MGLLTSESSNTQHFYHVSQLIDVQLERMGLPLKNERDRVEIAAMMHKKYPQYRQAVLRRFAINVPIDGLDEAE